MCIFSWFLCAILCGVLCAVLYMCIFLWHCCSYVPLLIHMAGERSWLAQRFSPHHVVGRRWGNLLWQASERGYQFYFPKDVFVWALYMSLTSICNIMLLVGFFESSKSHLSSDRRDRSCLSIEWSCSSTEELWCIGVTRLWRKGLHLLCEKPAYHIYVEEVTSRGWNVRVGTHTVLRELAIDPL